VEGYFFDADLAFANFESPLDVSKPFSPLPEDVIHPMSLNNDADGFDRCCRGGKGFTLFSTANNHSLDMGVEGLLATLDFMDSRGCQHTGTARSQAEGEDIPMAERNGIRVALLAYTFSLNNRKVPEGKEYLVSYLRLNKPGCDLSVIKKQVEKRRGRKNTPMWLSPACTGGLEYESFPLEAVIATGRRIADLGVDVIVGNHPHVIQPAELYVSPGGKAALKEIV
jgi:poly-gamma-glutamate synthesis protein (capsule biosynthesis protein)